MVLFCWCFLLSACSSFEKVTKTQAPVWYALGTTQLHSVNQQPRRSRYSLHELWETDATAASLDTSETLRPPGSLKNHSDSQQSFDAMLSQEKLQVAVTPFIEGGLKECHGGRFFLL